MDDRDRLPSSSASAKAVSPFTVTSDGKPQEDKDKLPPNTVGLALSGGGIRSATFALGVLQALAKRNRLRDVDFLSTVSGGGFIGSFLGRLFTRDAVRMSKDPVGRVQETLADTRSAPLWWLRTQANYIFATGSDDLRQNLAIFWRNIFTVHLVIGALLFTLFGLLAWLPGAAGVWLDRVGSSQLRTVLERLLAPPIFAGIELSVWWWLPVLALALGVLPATLGFWLAPKTGSNRPYPFFSLLAWLVLVAGAGVALRVPHGLGFAAGALFVLLLAWFWQEAARWGALEGPDTAAEERQLGTIVRNRLGRGLGEAVTIFAVLVLWVVLDTFAVLFARRGVAGALVAILLALGPLLPLLRWMGMQALQQLSVREKASAREKKGVSLIRVATLLGIPLAIFLLWILDVLAHTLFAAYPAGGFFVILLTGIFSATIGRAFDFLNLSSLSATYGYATRAHLPGRVE